MEDRHDLGTLVGAIIIGILDKEAQPRGAHFSPCYIVKGLVVLGAVFGRDERDSRGYKGGIRAETVSDRCILFSHYHVDPRNEKVHGPGWTEWELVKRGEPKFRAPAAKVAALGLRG